MRVLAVFFMRALREFRLRRRFPLSVIHGGVIVDGLSSLGDYSVLFPYARVMNSSLGKYSYIQENTNLYCADVGPFCSIAANVTIGLINHPMEFVSTSPVFYDKGQPLPRSFVPGNDYINEIPRTIIEADVWIGEGAKLRAGVRIGVGAVIGAGSLVTKDIPPYSVAVGIPSKTIKYRFTEDVRKKLIESSWWIFNEEELQALSSYFNDPIKFIDAINNKLR